jgi:hypothetical protein
MRESERMMKPTSHRMKEKSERKGIVECFSLCQQEKNKISEIKSLKILRHC